MDLNEALAISMVKTPNLAAYFIKDIRGRIAASEVLKALKQSGFDLSTPSGVVLEALLSSGAVSPTDALEIYAKLNEAQLGIIQYQSALIDLEYKKALLENVRANTLATLQNIKGNRAELNAKLVNEYFAPKLERIRMTIKQIDSMLSGLMEDPTKAAMAKSVIEELEARRNAYVVAEEALNMWRILAIEELNRLTEAGMPAPLIVGTAIARANTRFQTQFKEWLLDETLGLPTQDDIHRGRISADEFVKIIATEVSPEYARLTQLLLNTASGGVLPMPTTPIGEAKSEDKDDGISFSDALTVGGAVVGVGFGAWKLFGKAKSVLGKRDGFVPKIAESVGRKFVPDRLKQLKQTLKEMIDNVEKTQTQTQSQPQPQQRVQQRTVGQIRGRPSKVGGWRGFGMRAIAPVGAVMTAWELAKGFDPEAQFNRAVEEGWIQ